MQVITQPLPSHEPKTHSAPCWQFTWHASLQVLRRHCAADSQLSWQPETPVQSVSQVDIDWQVVKQASPAHFTLHSGELPEHW